MNYRIEITPEGKADILKARDWYNEQSQGLGADFALVIKLHINSLKSDTVEHKQVINNVRRMLVKRFPYVIYYTRNEELKLVKIISVLRDRQNRPFTQL
jgi:hypothetical protein